MGHGNKTKNDQIAGCAGKTGLADSQRGPASIFTSIQPETVHTAPIICNSGLAAISKDRLSRHYRDAQGLLRSTQSTGTEEDTSLLHPLLCRTTAGKKRAFESLLTTIFTHAQAMSILDEPVEGAIDSTGLENNHASRHFVKCTKRPSYFRRRWPKITVVCDTHTHLIAGCIVTRGPSYDFGLFEPAMRQADSQVKFSRILADAGYDSETNHQFAREVLGIETVIALNARGFTSTPCGTYRAQMKDNFDKQAYNRRWQVESVFSRNKRLLGSALRARKDNSRQRECLLRILTHNLMIIRCAA